MTYDEVESFLLSYSTEESPYDANGAIHLLKAILSNLRVNTIDADLEDYAACLEVEDEEYLRKILKFIPLSRASQRKN